MHFKELTQHSNNFEDWVRENAVEGEDGHGNCAQFVSPSALSKYWNWHRVQTVLRDSGAAASVATIQQAYIRVFSILVYTNQISSLDNFLKNGLNDERLPLEQAPSQWPKNDDDNNNVLEKFKEHQWRFCPLRISCRSLLGQTLDDRHILPIKSKTLLHKPQIESEIRKVVFYRDCIDDELPGTIILKSYTHPSTAQSLYKAEVDAFTKIRNSASKQNHSKFEYIIEFYGHFKQNKKYYILLEHAEGDLDSYFNNTKPPEDAPEMIQFWESMFKLIHGLSLIHNLGDPDEQSTSMSLGSHQDIKPDNILVARGNRSSDYRITLKIADFGKSDFWNVSDDNRNVLGVDNRGDQIYSAPECIVNYPVLERFTNRVGSEVDIWSLGCLFSESAVWATCGQEGRQEYLRKRVEETQGIESMARSGFEGCFHDGIRALSQVAIMHDHILKNRRPWDTITPEVIELIRDSMLLEPMIRKSAKKLLQLSGQIKQKAEQKARELGYIPTHVPRTPTDPELSSNKITVDDVLRYRLNMKSDQSPNKYVATQIKLLQERIKGRDQIFLIDDSKSMKTEHQTDCEKTFTALSYIAKRIDDNEIDLFFTSHPSKMYHNRKTSRLLTDVQEHYHYSDSGPSMMEDSMSQAINYIDKQFSNIIFKLNLKPPPRITLFVLTDGKWGDAEGTVPGIEEEIKRLIKTVQSNNLGRTSVAIQFIRFGDDYKAMERLSQLDDFGKSLDWDIVDTKAHTDHVPDMFIGSIDNGVDEKGE
ncbi:kinase-like domain-containing protein [Hypoxylon fragiforme]|uniref:kinase-like domain-containing protein n=1 Tax=Hypoxylon fragiforme TaxID=63214 RepID=UPI0020C6CF1D|nr:kinase-like domain-containing protein [Hypoxylon fragiforme]KAI2605497.1 kinase-like domain-containing protein [Hypoxylon fragiforme]